MTKPPPHHLRHAGPRERDIQADETAFRLACFRLREFAADQADPHIHDAICKVLARVAPEEIDAVAT